MSEQLSPSGDGRVPGTPPAEVLDALDRAACVLEDLDREQVTLELLQDRSSARLRISVSHEGEYGSHELSGAALLRLLDGDTTEVER